MMKEIFDDDRGKGGAGGQPPGPGSGDIEREQQRRGRKGREGALIFNVWQADRVEVNRKMEAYIIAAPVYEARPSTLLTCWT